MLGMGGGARKRGRPRARWLDYIKTITNCTPNELCGLTRGRWSWKSPEVGLDLTGQGNKVIMFKTVFYLSEKMCMTVSILRLIDLFELYMNAHMCVCCVTMDWVYSYTCLQQSKYFSKVHMLYNVNTYAHTTLRHGNIGTRHLHFAVDRPRIHICGRSTYVLTPQIHSYFCQHWR